ncbi:bacterial Ig-like domain-containing protein [Acetobacterium sp.]|uniref:bacterial Ig-like domain-containing protein n=1 Tax=Acetobacterium sp. TaxID=1872094 RepID=UPI00271EA449|nr:bacterial Ig-like domain-containing protein [Acetobacterium sp.]MDO9490949.1 bacterial Ig-like domain-containing protein [Acetobacterium sp.]
MKRSFYFQVKQTSKDLLACFFTGFQRLHLIRLNFFSIMVMIGVLLIAIASPIFETDSVLAANSQMTANEDVVVSDTEQFIRWHTNRSNDSGEIFYHGDTPESVIEAMDGSYVVAGYSSGSNNAQYTVHAYLTKFNANGSIAWDRTYGLGIKESISDAKNYKFLKVIQLANGDYLAVGSTNDNLGMSKDGFTNIFAVRIDNAGNTKWQKAYGLQDKTTSIDAWDAVENDDGTLSIWGNYIYNYPELIELTLGSDGSLLGKFVITDGDLKSVPCGMSKTPDGGTIAYQHIFNLGFWSDAIVKLKPDGLLEWAVRYTPDESSTDYAQSPISESKIFQFSDGYLIAGLTMITNQDGNVKKALMAYKLDLNGNLLWTKLYQNLTANDYATGLNATKTSSGDLLLSVGNGASPNEFVVIKMNSADGSVSWVKSYGEKNGFDSGYGGNTEFKMIENSNGQIIGAGRENYLTKFAGDGSIAFSTDAFIVQNNTNYLVSSIEMTEFGGGFFIKHSYAEGTVLEKDVSVLTGFRSQDGLVVAEGAQTAVLQSIAITTPATKLSYKIGDVLDISGLVVTGTYSDGSTKTETITVANASGFNSAIASENQVLTITVGSKTTSYSVRIVAATDVGVQERRIFNSWNVGGVESGTAMSPTFTITEPYALTFISTYHYLGSGQPAGTISLRHEDGTIYGPWTPQLVNNCVWVINNKAPGTHEDFRADLGTVVSDSKYPVIKAGTYTVIDSNPSTWSINEESGYYGFTEIKGYKTSEIGGSTLNCSYRTHVQNVGWQDWKTNGAMSGTSGQGLRLEGIEIKVDNQNNDLGIQYSTHVQNIGWQGWQYNGTMSGTSGQALRLEAIKINLTGTDAGKFDIYYQVHAQNFGWLDWAKNGQESGTAGFGYRLEGIRIQIVPKGDPAPGSTTRPFVSE